VSWLDDLRVSGADSHLTGAVEIASRVGRGEWSAVAVASSHLERIRLLNQKYNFFCFVYEEEALATAAEIDRMVQQGRTPGPFWGVPYALKDFMPTKGKVTTLGSEAFKDWIPTEDPPVVERLRQAGGILLGKTTTSELAHSSFTRSHLWGVSRNPWDSSRTPGGSSGGSAGAVATGMVAVAEGSDAGGSVRIPASCCGVVGYKPPLGRVPMHSTGNDFETIFHHGPLARSVDDCALMLNVMAGPDERDPLSLLDRPSFSIPVPVQVSGLRVALSIDLGFFEVDPQVRDGCLAVGMALRELGATVDQVELGWEREVVDSWAAYWGVLLAAMYGDKIEAYGEVMDPALLRLIRQGQHMDAVSFKQIDLARSRQWQCLAPVLQSHEVLICPTLAVPVPAAEGLDDDSYGAPSESGKLLGLDMTCPFNFVPQCPVISVPCGRTKDGLPIGVQVVGRRFDDLTVLMVAKAIERVVSWGSR